MCNMKDKLEAKYLQEQQKENYEAQLRLMHTPLAMHQAAAQQKEYPCSTSGLGGIMGSYDQLRNLH